jgi:hypothetical protein
MARVRRQRRAELLGQELLGQDQRSGLRPNDHRHPIGPPLPGRERGVWSSFLGRGLLPASLGMRSSGRVVTDFTLPAEHVIGPAHLVQLLAVPMEGPGRPRWRRPE